MKINYQKLNASFFFIGIIASVLLQAINSVIMKYDFSQLRLIMIISIVAVIICFYRFNNGLIALIRGRFGKPRKNDLNYVDYDEKKTVFNLKEEIGDTLLVYKLNSRDTYQIIKQKDRLLLRKCVVEHMLHTCETEETLANPDSIKFARGDISIRYESIDKITYKISPTNYYAPIIEIKVGKKTYRYIGFLEPFDFEEIEQFFKNACKVNKESNKKKDEKIKAEKGALLFKILNLISCVVAPNILMSSVYEVKSSAHILTSVYMLISIVILILYILLPIINPKVYGYETDYKKLAKNQNDTLIAILLICLLIMITIISHQSVINFAWYVILSGGLTAALIYPFVKSSGFYNKLDEPFTRTLSVLAAVLIVALSSASIVSGINYTIPLKSYSQTYTINDKWEQSTSKGGVNYYASIRIDGKDEEVMISSDTYESNSNHIQLVRTRGLFGIEYIAEDYMNY